jgi:nitrite reductase/ring-hydroxylating ferredoxin subunit
MFFYFLVAVVAALIIVLVSFYLAVFVIGKKRKRHTFDEEYEKERAKNYPPPYPNGWFSLGSSSMVKAGQVIEVAALGQKFAVFRGEDGKVGVLDVYCPHLNANLANGCVKGNNVVCPFHAWEFDKDGKCAHIPYTDTIPRKAQTKAYHVQENWGLIMLWHHSDGIAPTWSTEGCLKEVEEYKYHSMTSDVLRIHLQDFAENGADYAHFAFVHDILTIPFANKFVYVKHTLNIEFGEGEKGHEAYFSDQADLVFRKNDQLVPQAGGFATVTFFGPGFLVFKFKTRVANVLLVKTFTPLGELKVRMDDYVYAPKGTPGLMIKYILGEASAQFHDDIAIWEKKNFATKPLLVKGDGPIMKMRAWYSQFYTENSYLQRGTAAPAKPIMAEEEELVEVE